MPVRIVEGKLPYTGGTGIEIDTNKVISLLLREENNLIMVNDDNEVYTDLQLESGLTPSSDFPVGVTVGKVLQTDGWTQNGLILNWKTTSGDYARWIYANDGKIYFDGGNGTWQRVYYSSEVDTLLTNLRNEVYQYFMKWSDFERDTQTGVNVILSLTTETTPTADFTVSAPTTVRTGQEYVLRVNSVDTAYVMTLGTGIVNPKLVNINLHPHTSDVFVFLALDDGTLELQPIVEPGATANDGVLTIQKNGTTVATFTANQGTNTTANIEVPTVVDNLTTQSSTNALSANQGYELKGMIDDLAGFGKFLSLWNATTGMPISFPLATPYTYSTGDYFVVEVVSSATPPVNYRPNGSSYTGTASSTAETDELEVGDVYVYDGSVWLLQSNHGKTVSFGNIAGDPYDNTNLGNALNAKQDTLIAGSNITIAADGKTISANNTTYSSATTTTAGIVKLGSDTAISEAIQSPAGATNKTYPVQLNSSGQMGVNVPRANTTYGAGTGINIDGNNDIQNTGVTSFNGSTGAVTYTAPVTSVNTQTGAVTVNDVKVAAAAPASPTEGMTWYDTTNDQLKVYDGSNWKVTGSDGEGVRIFKLTTDTPDAATMTAIAEAIRGSVNGSSISSELASRFMYPVYIERAYDSYDSGEDAYTRQRYVYKLTSYWVSAQTGYEEATFECIVGNTILILVIKGNPYSLSYGTYEYSSKSINNLIQNDTTGTTTTVTKIWAGSEAEYNSLGTYSQSTIYHIY